MEGVMEGVMEALAVACASALSALVGTNAAGVSCSLWRFMAHLCRCVAGDPVFRGEYCTCAAQRLAPRASTFLFLKRVALCVVAVPVLHVRPAEREPRPEHDYCSAH
jgi:hypothetical protein